MAGLSLTTVIALAAAAVAVNEVGATPLDDYVNTPDSHYTYRYLTKFPASGVTVHLLNMTSQMWLTTEVTTNPIWWHFLYVIIPDRLDYTDVCFLLIGGDDNDEKPATLADEHLERMTVIADTTGSVTAVIKQIPNQPIVFQDDPERTERTEDAIIAWSWKKFIANGSNPEILLRLPMTKAVVRGMDTVTSFVKSLTGNTIDRYVIAGESKRGWTTWTTAAVDKRIIAMVPTVMDLLNIQQNLHHHYRSLGGWTFAFDDYYNVSITKELDNPNIPKMAAVIDPMTYNDRYTMPKLSVTTSGDEFFLPDDTHYYFQNLTGPKYISVLEKGPFPELTWERSQTGAGGKISAKTSMKPKTVRAFHAKTTDDKRRDFRLAVKAPDSNDPYPHPVVWFDDIPPTKISDLEYEFELERPATGWAAFYLEFAFEGPKNSTLELTTEACIIPDIFPFPDCSGASCYGTLV